MHGFCSRSSCFSPPRTRAGRKRRRRSSARSVASTRSNSYCASRGTSRRSMIRNMPRSRRVSTRSAARWADGKKDCKRKLPPDRRETRISFGREDTILGIPLVVVALPRVDVPLGIAGVPVHVDDALSRTRRLPYHRPSRSLRAESDSGPRSPLMPDTN